LFCTLTELEDEFVNSTILNPYSNNDPNGNICIGFYYTDSSFIAGFTNIPTTNTAGQAEYLVANISANLNSLAPPLGGSLIPVFQDSIGPSLLLTPLSPYL
jgi:hypothetical protein